MYALRHLKTIGTFHGLVSGAYICLGWAPFQRMGDSVLPRQKLGINKGWEMQSFICWEMESGMEVRMYPIHTRRSYREVEAAGGFMVVGSWRERFGDRSGSGCNCWRSNQGRPRSDRAQGPKGSGSRLRKDGHFSLLAKDA